MANTTVDPTVAKDFQRDVERTLTGNLDLPVALKRGNSIIFCEKQDDAYLDIPRINRLIIIVERQKIIKIQTS